MNASAPSKQMLVEAAISAHEETLYAARQRADAWRDASPQQRGKLAEYGVAARFQGAVWGLLPRAWRDRLSANGADRGVDVVCFSYFEPEDEDRACLVEITLVQVKWVRAGATIGRAAIEKLLEMKRRCIELWPDVEVVAGFVTPPGVRIAEVSGYSELEHVCLTVNEVLGAMYGEDCMEMEA